MQLEQLQTPALILDMDLFEQNMATMKNFLTPLGLALRPHYKSHKCTAIAHMQIAQGAKGICCAKLGEAEDLVNAGIEDVLIANQIIDQAKLARVAHLANCCYLTICVDNEENIKALEAAAAVQNATIHCLIEYEIGMKRCGVETPEAFYALAKEISDCPHLVFEGIQAYAGHLSHETDFETRKVESEKVEQRLLELRTYLEQKSMPVKEVSGASTGTVEFRTKNSVYTEIQAGSYIFMDTAYNALNLSFKSALFLLCTVMSTNPHLVIVDTGRKSVSLDQMMPILENYPQWPLKVSEEHSAVSAQECHAAIGDKLRMIPGHCCTAVNLHNHLYFVRGNKVIDKVPITSRGNSI